MKKFSSISSTLLFVSYLAYRFLPTGSISLIILQPFLISVKRHLRIDRDYFYVILYVLFVYIYTLLTFKDRAFINFLSSSKILVFIIFSVLLYNAIKLSKLDLEISLRKLRPLLSIILIVSLGFLIVYPRNILGMRGDVGLLLSVLSTLLIVYVYRTATLFHLTIVFIIFLTTFSCLILLGGRTAVITYSVILLSSLYVDQRYRGSKRSRQLSKVILPIFFCVAAPFVFITFQMRGNIENFSETEARVLALIYWSDVMTSTSWGSVVFGHGLGACANKISEGIALVSAHIAQIVRSSNACYVSWGFHNTILAFIFEYGIIGAMLICRLFYKIFINLRFEKRGWFIVFCIAVAFASPNNHFINNDLIGVMFFGGLTLFLKYKNR